MMGLIFHVSLHDFLLNADGRYEVSPSPQDAFWKLLALLLNPTRCFGFQDLNDVRDGIFGRNADMEMNMFISDMPGMNVKPFPMRNLLEFSFQLLFNIGV